MVRLTNQQQADALQCGGARYVQKLRERGLPKPLNRETKAAWLKRARIWIADHVQPKGAGRDGDPDDPTTLAHFARRKRIADTRLRELELAVREGDLHSKTTCEAETVQRGNALRLHLQRLPTELAEQCDMKPGDHVFVVADRLVREAIEDFVRAARKMTTTDAAPVDRQDARGPAVAGPARPERVGRRASRPRPE